MRGAVIIVWWLPQQRSSEVSHVALRIFCSLAKVQPSSSFLFSTTSPYQFCRRPRRGSLSGRESIEWQHKGVQFLEIRGRRSGRHMARWMPKRRIYHEGTMYARTNFRVWNGCTKTVRRAVNKSVSLFQMFFVDTAEKRAFRVTPSSSVQPGSSGLDYHPYMSNPIRIFKCKVFDSLSNILVFRVAVIVSSCSRTITVFVLCQWPFFGEKWTLDGFLLRQSFLAKKWKSLICHIASADEYA